MIKKIHNKFKKVWAVMCKPFDLFLTKGIDALFDWRNELADKENKYHCKNCKHHFSVILMSYKARFTDKKGYYNYKCPVCKHINNIKKGVEVDPQTEKVKKFIKDYEC